MTTLEQLASALEITVDELLMQWQALSLELGPLLATSYLNYLASAQQEQNDVRDYKS